jgi:hypothetical protein
MVTDLALRPPDLGLDFPYCRLPASARGVLAVVPQSVRLFIEGQRDDVGDAAARLEYTPNASPRVG